MHNPYFSIIIPTLNEENYVTKLLDNLSSQTEKDFEVIIVDANSEDNTILKAQTYCNQINLKIINTSKRNVCYQRNVGAKNAKGDWIVFSDADNQLPDFFLLGLKYRLNFNPTDIASSWFVPDSTNVTDQAIAMFTNQYVEIQKKTSNPCCLEAMLIFKKKVFLELSGFDENKIIHEGNEILRRAKIKNFQFEVYKDPAFVCSFRRLRTQGNLRSLRSSAQLEFSRIFNVSLTKEQLKKLYPMYGGAFFEQKEETTSRLKSLFNRFTNF